MIECPFCKEEITHLVYESCSTTEEFGSYYPDGTYEEHDRDYIHTDDMNYSCPNCEKEIATDQDSADDFFSGIY